MKTKEPTNPFRLKAAKLAATLAGGTEGHTDDAEHQPLVSSAAPSSAGAPPNAVSLSSDAHHALSAMIAGFISRDRALLDDAFEELVGLIEEMRDAVPKIQS